MIFIAIFGPKMDFCREGGPATNTTTKRHGTVDHDDGTPQLSNCRKLEACMSTHHQKGSSNIKVIRNSSISDSECFLTREIKDLMTFQDSLYVYVEVTICSIIIGPFNKSFLKIHIGSSQV